VEEAVSHEVTEAIWETLAAVIVVVDAAGRILRVNRAVERLSGWSSEELVGREFAAMLRPPDDVEEARAAFQAGAQRAPGSGRMRHTTTRWLTRSGEIRYIAWTNAGVWDGDGVMRFAVGTGIDITEQRAADLRLRDCLDAMVEGVCIIDAARDEHGAVVDFEVRYLNPAAVQFVGRLSIGDRVRDPLRIGGADSLYPSYVGVLEDGIPLDRRVEVALGDAVMTLDLSATRLEDGVVVTFRDVTAVRLAEERLAFAATHDPLTGLANRPLLIDRLRHALARRPSSPPAELAVLFVDLDGFKLVNDRLGHQVGDATLTRVARSIESVVRPADTVARFGGDEFVIVAEEVTTPADAEVLAKRVGSAIGEVSVGLAADAPPGVAVPGSVSNGSRLEALRLRASVGVSLARADDTPETLLRRADEAMYRSKRQSP
jgi:diguanylate cyclase (GGDEF)-like protein/PAS domain S-box-containing protein